MVLIWFIKYESKIAIVSHFCEVIKFNEIIFYFKYVLFLISKFLVELIFLYILKNVIGLLKIIFSKQGFPLKLNDSNEVYKQTLQTS